MLEKLQKNIHILERASEGDKTLFDIIAGYEKKEVEIRLSVFEGDNEITFVSFKKLNDLLSVEGGLKVLANLTKKVKKLNEENYYSVPLQDKSYLFLISAIVTL